MKQPKFRPHPRHPNYLCYEDGRIYSLSSRKFLNPKPQPNGYLRLSLGPAKKQKAYSFHRFIMEAFNGESSLFVNHKDGDKTNNSLSNMEYVSHRENIQHAFRSGLVKFKIGESRHNSKLTENQVLTIITLLNTGAPHSRIAPCFGVKTPTIWAIANNKSWKHLSFLKTPKTYKAHQDIRGRFISGHDIEYLGMKTPNQKSVTYE